jgi:hypothetical protein
MCESPSGVDMWWTTLACDIVGFSLVIAEDRDRQVDVAAASTFLGL